MLSTFFQFESTHCFKQELQDYSLPQAGAAGTLRCAEASDWALYVDG